jgi:hypothetical protein
MRAALFLKDASTAREMPSARPEAFALASWGMMKKSDG